MFKIKEEVLERIKAAFKEKTNTIYFDLPSLEIEYWKHDLELVLLLNGAVKSRFYIDIDGDLEEKIFDSLESFNRQRQLQTDFDKNLVELFYAEDTSYN